MEKESVHGVICLSDGISVGFVPTASMFSTQVEYATALVLYSSSFTEDPAIAQKVFCSLVNIHSCFRKYLLSSGVLAHSKRSERYFMLSRSQKISSAYQLFNAGVRLRTTILSPQLKDKKRFGRRYLNLFRHCVHLVP